jgi:hypothetical protein
MLTFVAEFYGPDSPGFWLQRLPESYLVTAITPGTPAARAGILPGDVLLQWDGIPFVNPVSWFMERTGPGQTCRLEVKRGGVRQSIPITFGYRSWRVHFDNASAIANLVTVLNALLSLVIGLFIVWARPRDWVALGFAWVLLCAPIALHAPAGVTYLWLSMPEAILVLLYLGLFASNVGLVPSFLASVMNFPRPLAARRWYLPLLYLPFLANQPFFVYPLWVRAHHPMAPGPSPLTSGIFNTLLAAYIIAALAAIVWNYRRLMDVNERRRLRVLMAGLAAGAMAFLPDFAIGGTPLAGVIGIAYYRSPLPVLFSLLQIALPTTIAYAILRHRVFDIRIMIRQGIQYAAARGLLLSAVPVLSVLLALDLLLHGNRPLVEVLRQRGWLYLISGALAFLLHARRHTWLAALDRRFFRERYDAQRVLREVVEEVRAARDFEKASRRVVAQIEATLHSETAAVMLRQPRGAVYGVLASSPAPPPAIPADSKIMGLVRLLAKPVEIPQTDTGWLRQQLPRDESEFLRQARLEWLFPISLGAEGAEAILAVGPKRSEEPYSREDQDLIQAITANLALLLERSPMAAEPAAGFHECPQCGACYDSGVSQCAHEGMNLTPVMLPRLLARRYHFERRLGQGGMGKVYEAHDTELDRRVAVKLIRPELMAGPDAVSRFKREARAAAALSHPNVVTVFDFSVGEDARAYLVMELLRGHTLRRELQLHGRLGAKQAGEIMWGVCGAVEAAHAQRLVHRDLKPENIFLIDLGGVEVAKVLDFGLAKPLAATEETVTLGGTAPGILMGTVRYMSPEQLRGGPPAESWDLWALAVVAYEILIGIYPFAAEGAADWHRAILAGRVIAPRTHLQDAPASWDSFFGRVLALDVNLRPPSAKQFAAEFQRIVT